MAPLGRRLSNCERPENRDEHYLLSLRNAILLSYATYLLAVWCFEKLAFKEMTVKVVFL